MDKFIPILIVIAIYLFKFYNNYKKEQEKNQNRKVPQSKTTPYERRVATRPANTTQAKNSSERLPKLEKAVQQNMSKKGNKQPQVDTPWYKSTTETYLTKAETASLQYEERSLLSDPLLKSNIKVVKLEEEISATEDNTQMNFDLREAVIQAAILERPYK